MFLDRARSVRRDFNADPDTLQSIVERLDGLPLAIELAAARVTVLSGKNLLERLSAQLMLDGPGRRDPAKRHATLRQALDWSWELLDEVERDALAQCSVFCGGFSVDAAEEVLLLEGNNAPLQVLESLRSKSLIRKSAPLAGEDRYDLYQSVREYAADKSRVEPIGSMAGIEERHSEFFLDVGRRWWRAIHGPSGTVSLRHLARERGNLQAVFERTLSSTPATAAWVALYLDGLFAIRGPRGTHRRVLDAAIEVGESLEPTIMVRLLRARGDAHRVWGDLELARGDLQTAVDLLANHPHRWLEAQVTGSLAILDFFEGRSELGRQGCHRAIALDDEVGNRIHEGLMRMALGIMLRRGGDDEGAVEQMGLALALHRRTGSQQFEGASRINLGNLLRAQGRSAESEEMYLEALTLLRRLEDHRAAATVLGNLGSLTAIGGQFSRAKAYFAEALHEGAKGLGSPE
ncbi:MAG: tetratricopeptide repeat protein, partial [Proteobacteria bacterium]|nr:tetratricopeptide repeat protein [Pseudomonadota bacterium]